MDTKSTKRLLSALALLSALWFGLVAAHASALSIPFVQNGDSYSAKTFGGAVLTKQGKIIHRLYAQEGAVVFSESVGFTSITPLNPSVTTITYANGAGAKPTFNTLYLGYVAPKITLRLEAKAQNVEKIWTLEAGANVADLQVAIEGARQIALNRFGELAITTEQGDVVFTKPSAYQTIDGAMKHVEAEYVIGQNSYGFKLGAYDRRYDVVIDPLLAATFTGGAAEDEIRAIAARAKGGINYIYAAGTTNSLAIGSNSAGNSSYNGFIARYDENLTTLHKVYFINGNDYDAINAIAFDSSNIYAVGETKSTDLSGGAPAKTNGFIVKLNDELTNQSAIKYIGGTEDDLLTGVTIYNNYIYAAGYSNSHEINGSTTANENHNGFITKLDTNLNIQKTVISGFSPAPEHFWAIKTAKDGNITAVGDIDNNISIVVFDSNLNIQNKNISNTPSGKSSVARAIETNGTHIFIGGETTAGAENTCESGIFSGTSYSGKNGFVAVFDISGLTVLKTCYGGGSSDDVVTSLALSDDQSMLFMGGYTTSANFTLSGTPFQSTSLGSEDGFIITASLATLSPDKGTFYGSSGNDRINALAAIGSDSFAAGSTTGQPRLSEIKSAASSAPHGKEGFIARFSDDVSSNAAQIHTDPASINFHSVAVGSQTGPNEIKISNGGSQKLTGMVITLEGANAEDWELDKQSCAGVTELAPLATCVVKLTFKPIESLSSLALYGAKTAILKISATEVNASSLVESIELNGTATHVTGTRLLGYFDSNRSQNNAYTFANTPINTSSSIVTLTLENTGSETISYNNDKNFTVTLTNSDTIDHNFTVVGHNCPVSLPTATSCVVQLRFSPSAMGNYSRELRMYSNGAPLKTWQLHGTGTNELSITPSGSPIVI
ncbi:MAG: choice-of-anchor D domain-containing protein, partial [Helicobacteraceae bacterium]|nr:choice-of-anchor D domain-containing protein [Helicobacteraceae bacterium]